MKNKLILALVISLIASGLLAIIILLSDNFDRFSFRILISTLAVTVYSVIGLCCASLESTRYFKFSKLGLTITAIGFLYAIITTWVTPEDLEFLKNRFSFLVVAIGFAHASLMLHFDQKSTIITTSLSISLISNIVLSLLLLIIINGLFFDSDSVFILLGIVSIVGLISTITTPLLSKVAANK